MTPEQKQVLSHDLATTLRDRFKEWRQQQERNAEQRRFYTAFGGRHDPKDSGPQGAA